MREFQVGDTVIVATGDQGVITHMRPKRRPGRNFDLTNHDKGCLVDLGPDNDSVWARLSELKLVTPAWQPEPGEMVEVSDDGKDWRSEPREFFAMDGDQYVCRFFGGVDRFKAWPYVRPVKRLVTFGDGMQYMIDRETEERWRRELEGQND